MPFERFEFTKDWTAGPDEGDRYFPTYQDSEGQVREDLQLLPDELKNAINALLDKLESADAAGLIGDGQKGNLAATLTHIYSEVARVEDDLKTLAAGGAPEAIRTAVVTFAEEDWVFSNELYTITIPQSEHGRGSFAFGYQLWSDGTAGPVSDTWAVHGTDVVYYSDGNIVLTAEEPYGGRIAFFGV